MPRGKTQAVIALIDTCAEILDRFNPQCPGSLLPVVRCGN